MAHLILVDSSGSVVYTTAKDFSSDSVQFMPLMATQNVFMHALEQDLGIRRIRGSTWTYYLMKKQHCLLILKCTSSRQTKFSQQYFQILWDTLLWIHGPSIDELLDSYTERKTLNLSDILPILHENIIRCLDPKTHKDYALLLETTESAQISSDLQRHCQDELKTVLNALDENPEVELFLFASLNIVTSSHSILPSDLFCLSIWLSLMESRDEISTQAYFGGILKQVIAKRLFCNVILVGLVEGKPKEFFDAFDKLQSHSGHSLDEEIFGFLDVRAEIHVSMISFLTRYPGIVCFAYKDASAGLSTVPCLEGLWKICEGKELERRESEIRTCLDDLVDRVCREQKRQPVEVLTTCGEKYRAIYKRFGKSQIWTVWVSLVSLQFAEPFIDRLEKELATQG